MALASILKPSMPFLIILLSSAGAAPSPLASPAMKATTAQENAIISGAMMKQEMNSGSGGSSEKTTAAAPNDIMIVDAKEMAKDWKSAFAMLRNKQTGTIVFTLANGEMVKDIADIDPLPGGYLMLFTLKTLHGMQYKIIKTSEIAYLETQ